MDVYKHLKKDEMLNMEAISNAMYVASTRGMASECYQIYDDSSKFIPELPEGVVVDLIAGLARGNKV